MIFSLWVLIRGPDAVLGTRRAFLITLGPAFWLVCAIGWWVGVTPLPFQTRSMTGYPNAATFAAAIGVPAEQVACPSEMKYLHGDVLRSPGYHRWAYRCVSRDMDMSMPIPSRFVSERQYMSVGWPFRCFAEAPSWNLTIPIAYGDGTTMGPQGRVQKYKFPWFLNRIVQMPVKWAHFLANWIIIGSALGIAMMFIPGRRERRRRKGLCLHCGYPRGQAAVCTECGKNFNPMNE